MEALLVTRSRANESKSVPISDVVFDPSIKEQIHIIN